MKRQRFIIPVRTLPCQRAESKTRPSNHFGHAGEIYIEALQCSGKWMKNFLLLLFLRFLVWNCRLACNLMAVEISIDHMSGIGTITTSSYQQASPSAWFSANNSNTMYRACYGTWNTGDTDSNVDSTDLTTVSVSPSPSVSPVSHAVPLPMAPVFGAIG